MANFSDEIDYSNDGEATTAMIANLATSLSDDPEINVVARDLAEQESVSNWEQSIS